MMINRIMKYLRRLVDDYLIIKGFVRVNEENLENGKYRMISSEKKILYLRNSDTLRFIHHNSLQLPRINSFSLKAKGKLENFIFNFLSKVICRNEEKKEIVGSLIMMNDLKNFKIFDFHRKKVLNIFQGTPEEYKKIKTAYKELSLFFKIPIESFLDSEVSFVEQYLDFKPYGEWSQKERNTCVITIFENYINYFQKSRDVKFQSKKNLNDLLEELSKSERTNQMFISKLRNIITTYDESSEYEMIFQHGDFKFKNILLYQGEYHLIDLEGSCSLFFFHDLFDLFFFEGMVVNDYSYLKAYFLGEYDQQFSKIFSIFNETFDEKRKIYYFSAYIIEEIVESNFETMDEASCESLLELYQSAFFKVYDEFYEKARLN